MTKNTPATQGQLYRGFFGDDFDNLFEGFLRPMRSVNEPDNGNLVPAVDVVEDDKQYTITAELPGVERKDIDVSISDGVLTINAERKTESNDKDEKGRIIRRESKYGRYARSMRLDNSVNMESIKASHENGILKLELPKADTDRKKKIRISVK